MNETQKSHIYLLKAAQQIIDIVLDHSQEDEETNTMMFELYNNLTKIINTIGL